MLSYVDMTEETAGNPEQMGEKKVLTPEEVRNLFKTNPELRNRLGFVIGRDTKIHGPAIESFLDGKSDIFPLDLETSLQTLHAELTEQLGEKSSIDDELSQLGSVIEQYKHLFQLDDSQIDKPQLQSLLSELQNLSITTLHLGAFFEKNGFDYGQLRGYLEQIAQQAAQSYEDAGLNYLPVMTEIRRDWEMISSPVNHQNFSQERKQVSRELLNLIAEKNVLDSVAKLNENTRQSAQDAADLGDSPRSVS